MLVVVLVLVLVVFMFMIFEFVQEIKIDCFLSFWSSSFVVCVD